jgi:hypothetical protein
MDEDSTGTAVLAAVPATALSAELALSTASIGQGPAEQVRCSTRIFHRQRRGRSSEHPLVA